MKECARLAAALLLVICWPVHAQFEKTRWPARQLTPPVDWQDVQGQRWHAASLANRVVVLNFWATWCAPCKEELPSLQTLHEISGGNPLVIGVNVREPAARVKRYLQATGLDFPVVLDPQGELAKQWGVSVYPTTILMGPDGKAQWRIKGDVDWSGPEAQRWLQSMPNPSPAHTPAQR
jgi:thiol-disulfide isomerase/thioredoxin